MPAAHGPKTRVVTLAELFRRDAFKPSVRLLGKYKELNAKDRQRILKWAANER